MSSAEHTTDPRGVAEAFRRARSNVSFFPYEVFYPIDRADRARVQIADRIIASGWQHQSKPPVSLRPPVDWANACTDDRSWQFYLQAWYGLAPILAAYQRTKADGYLEFALQTALDWIAVHPSLEAQSELAWYDMSIALRGYRLAYIADAVLRANMVGDDEALRIRDSLLLHLSAFASDERFASHSNHGFYFAAGQAAMARRFPDLPGARGGTIQAAGRIRQIVTNHFTAEGVHKEHSPEYHQQMLGTLRGLAAAGLIDDETVLDRQATIEEALSWFILPNGHLTMFGDSPHRKFGWDSEDPTMHSALRFVASGGEKGELPVERLKPFSESGYAIARFRGPQGFRSSTQLALSAAFHSRSHKHADDLSFVWYDRGVELLVDAGRFGYRSRSDPASQLFQEGFWYDDPSRVYVESTAAHNTVEVDGRSYNRRLEKPYGSGICRAVECSGLIVLEGEVTHLEAVRHSRVLVLNPAQWLLVFDWLCARETHDYVQNFHLAPEFHARRDRHVIRASNGASASLNMIALDGHAPTKLVHGQSSPHLHGWISRRDGELEPCWAVGYAQRQVAQATFSTLFTLGPSAPESVERPTISELGRQGHWIWQDGDGIHDLRLSRRHEDSLRLQYEVGASG